jgi:hypothetical protein
MNEVGKKRRSIQRLAGVVAGCFANGISRTVGAQTAGGGLVQKIVIPVFVRADDPRLENKRLERAYLGHPLGSALDGLNLAVKDSSFELDAARIDLQFSAVRISSIEQVRTEALKLAQAGALMRERACL